MLFLLVVELTRDMETDSGPKMGPLSLPKPQKGSRDQKALPLTPPEPSAGAWAGKGPAPGSVLGPEGTEGQRGRDAVLRKGG